MSDSSFRVISDYSDTRVNKAEVDQLDITQLDSNNYHLIHDNQSMTVEVESRPDQHKSYTVTINGNKYEILIKDEYDQLIEDMGLNSISNLQVSDIIAPMPGLILDIMVKEGDTVRAGDPILILEAMKMENVIKAVGDGIVQSINAKKGEAVDKGHVIIEMQS